MSARNLRSVVRALVNALFFVGTIITAAITRQPFELLPAAIFGFLSIWAITAITEER